MNILSETVSKLYIGLTKVMVTVTDDEDGYIVTTKKVYFAGIKIYEKSSYREKSIRDTIMQTWGGTID